jgi:rhodanese-related sulfurtransferase
MPVSPNRRECEREHRMGEMNEEQSIPEVGPIVAGERLDAGEALILDVREPEELQQVSVTGALHIPLGDLHYRLEEIPRDRDVYVLCHVGQRSAIATEFLRHLGHERVWNIRGGIVGWLRSGLPADWAKTG